MATLAGALDRFGADAAAVGDEDLLAEAAFWTKLLELRVQGAPQGSQYPG